MATVREVIRVDGQIPFYSGGNKGHAMVHWVYT
jgi:hypothetical protein